MRARAFVAGMVVLASSVGCAGPTTQSAFTDSIARRVRDCTCAGGWFIVETERLQDRVVLSDVDGLSPEERACAVGSVAAIPVPRELAGYRFRVRQTTRDPGPRPPRGFVEARASEIDACLPARTVRIVATPADDHFDLSVELLEDEPDLTASERACVLSALDGMPDPEPGAVESVVTLGPAAPCRPRRELGTTR